MNQSGENPLWTKTNHVNILEQMNRVKNHKQVKRMKESRKKQTQRQTIHKNELKLGVWKSQNHVKNHFMQMVPRGKLMKHQRTTRDMFLVLVDVWESRRMLFGKY